jgi:hypothetical protein
VEELIADCTSGLTYCNLFDHSEHKTTILLGSQQWFGDVDRGDHRLSENKGPVRCRFQDPFLFSAAQEWALRPSALRSNGYLAGLPMVRCFAARLASRTFVASTLKRPEYPA